MRGGRLAQAARRLLAVVALAAVALAFPYRIALSDPVVRHAELRLLPPGTNGRVRLLLGAVPDMWVVDLVARAPAAPTR